MSQKTLSVEEVYQKGIKDLNEELYRAYARITKLLEDREKVIAEVQVLCKKISSHSDLGVDESLIKLQESS
jgi:hypothetical protein